MSNSNETKLDESKAFSLFKGYDKNSTRYQTKRQFELEGREEEALNQLRQIELILSSDTSKLSDLELEIYEKRYKSLKKLFKIENKKNRENLLFIPIRLDIRTVYFVEESQCFNEKWIRIIGSEKKMKKRIELYKSILHYKPINELYWNPF